MSRYTNILLASMAAAVFFLSGTFWQSAGHNPYKSLNGSQASFWGFIGAPLSSIVKESSTRVAVADVDSEDSEGDKKDAKDGKDEEDGAIKELWDSVQLG